MTTAHDHTGTASPELGALRAVGDAERSTPPVGLEAALRERFPTEDEYDLVLSRKLESRRRGGTEWTGSIDDLAARLDRFLAAVVDGGHERSPLRRLSGGGAKIQVGFDLETDRELHGRHRHHLVVRVEPTESLNATSRRREAQLIELVRPVVPVPEVYWVDEAGEWFSEPALIYTFVPGVTRPSGTTTQVGGVGGRFGGELRERLATRFVADIARIHTVDVGAGADLSAFDVPAVGSVDSALWQVNRARRIWEEDRGEDLPYVEAVALWLLDRLPPLDRLSALHGDYRTGNFLFDEVTGEITAWLDWERGHLGDRHRDLAWITLPQWGRPDPDTGELLVSGLLPLSEFERRYEESSGLAIDRERLRFYRVLNSFQLVVSTLGTAYRVARLGRSHQDVLLTSIEGIAHSFAHEMRTAVLEEG